MANTSKTKVTEDTIVKWYMETVLEHETMPKSVFKFCKEKGIEEEEFYSFFGSFQGLREAIWERFFANTLQVMQKNKSFGDMSNEDKMLTFFFTLFEALTLNRSYVLFTLQEHQNSMENLSQLKGLRKNIKTFASELIEERNETKNLKVLRYSPQLFSEGAWVQFLFLLKFWMNDSSPNFEKTDIAIEKSVTTIFQVLETTPLEKVLDFGKFLYKESFA